jgi:serine/threonine protein kinase
VACPDARGQCADGGIAGQDAIAGIVHKQVGRYELIEFLGRGGMADVYLARVLGLADFKRLFAVKMIRSDLPEWTKFGQFFIDEARITVHLQHPNIVQMFDLGRCDTGPYLGMEYVDGPDLRQIAASRKVCPGFAPVIG